MRTPPPFEDAEDPKSATSAEIEEEPKLGTVGLVLLIVFWYSSSVIAITTSKICMTIVRVPFVLCFAQFLSAAALTGALSRVVEKKQLSSNTAKPHIIRRAKLCGVFKIACVFSCGFVLTNTALSMASAPFVETLKAAEPVSTALLAGLLLGEFESL
jgi:solute carrier family 35 protein E1